MEVGARGSGVRVHVHMCVRVWSMLGPEPRCCCGSTYARLRAAGLLRLEGGLDLHSIGVLVPS